MSRVQHRRGATAIQVALSLMVTGGFCAMAMELAYLQVVVSQLQTVADSASHAAILKLDGTANGVAGARADAKAIAAMMRVNNKPFVLQDSHIVFGDWDNVTKTFVPTADATRIDSVAVRPSESHVGLGLGKAFLGHTFSPSVCGAVGKGPGNANTGVVGGPGVRNGHFDVDTVDALYDCPGNTVCNSYYRHTHTYDDMFSTTEYNAFAPQSGHWPINGCRGTNGSGSNRPWNLQPCPGGGRIIPTNQSFKLLLVNTLLSKGGKLVINGVTYKAIDYGNIPVASLPTYTLDTTGVGTRLTSLVMQFDVDSIANCELHPTPPWPTWDNTPGIYNEWRNGSLTLQAVKFPGFIQNGSPTRKNGGHEPVVSYNNGLYWENYFFWHWEAGIEYASYSAAAWLAQREALACFEPEFIDDIVAPGNVACN